ncbi:P-loop containing nucleoside triphosphate hydrolase protein [Thozetella sp. PMI_491]|nr:P-loop containing nucleoside triphosphate hydrolase protein [Thozetella sp. PMI_491]
MDYHSIHGHDISSFDLALEGQLPSVTAAQALEDLETGASKPVSTGLEVLDKALACGVLGDSFATNATPGGVQRGQVTEVWGPPGSGKTSLGLQLTANTLGNGEGVVWVDGFHPLCSQRLNEVVQLACAHQQDGVPGHHNDFSHFSCPTLAHFLALLCNPPYKGIPPTASLIVIDSLSALINHAFPRITDYKLAAGTGGKKAPNQSFRRIQALQHIVSRLQKLAATRNLAVVILTQCATRMQADRGATLVPAITANVWENGISTRVVLFRDWVWDGDKSEGLHFAGIQKLDGKGNYGAIEHIAAFSIKPAGLVPVSCEPSQSSIALSSTPAQKRKLHDASFEVADSDDEDYGWGEEDDNTVPPMPSQWQGSEDLILGTQPATDDEEGLESEDDEPEGDAGSQGPDVESDGG